MKNNAKVIIFYVLLIGVIFLAVYAMLGSGAQPEDPIYSDIMQYFEEDRVKEFVVTNENVLNLIVYKSDKVGTLTPEDVAGLKTTKISYRLRDIGLFKDDFDEFKNNQNLIDYDFQPLAEYSWILSMLPTILLLGVMVFFFFYSMKQMNKREGGMMSFGKAKAQTSSARSTNNSSHG